MRNAFVMALFAVFFVTGCAAVIPDKATPVQVGNNVRYYVPWRTDNKGGPEMVGMDTYNESGDLVHRAQAGGNSIAGQTLNGVAASAVNGVGLGVPAALGAWQTHINERNTNVVGSANTQGQIQGQGQQQGQASSNTNTNTPSATNTNTNSATGGSVLGSGNSTNWNTNHNSATGGSNTNTNNASGGQGGNGGSGSKGNCGNQQDSGGGNGRGNTCS